MNITLNELSLRRLESRDESTRIFMQLSDVVCALTSLGFKSLKVWNKDYFYSFPFTNDVSLGKWLRQKSYDTNTEKIKSQRLKSILTKQDSLWTSDDSAAVSHCPIVGISYQNSQEIPEGFKIACITNSIAVSFDTEVCWDNCTIDLIYLYEDSKNNTIEQSVQIKHAAKIEHVDSHRIWIKNLLLKGDIAKTWDPTKEFFPCLDYSNQIMPQEDWGHFVKHRDSLDPSAKIAYIIEIGTQVAERNNYSYDQVVSALNRSKNQLRKVFGAGVGNKRVYLSIDMEKGGFEICDYLGNHQGEYFYNGNRTAPRDKSHNIRVKS